MEWYILRYIYSRTVQVVRNTFTYVFQIKLYHIQAWLRRYIQKRYCDTWFLRRSIRREHLCGLCDERFVVHTECCVAVTGVPIYAGGRSVIRYQEPRVRKFSRSCHERCELTIWRYEYRRFMGTKNVGHINTWYYHLLVKSLECVLTHQVTKLELHIAWWNHVHERVYRYSYVGLSSFDRNPGWAHLRRASMPFQLHLCGDNMQN